MMDWEFGLGLYRYRATVREPFDKYVRDGDTFTVDLDLGLEIVHHGFTVRPVGYDAPEITGPERPQGILARDELRRLFAELKARDKTATLYLETLKNPDMVERQSGKRYLARVWVPDADGNLEDLAQIMRRLGHDALA